MTTLNQAINGTVDKKVISLDELQRRVDFFKDGVGNRYQLQMTGDTDDNGNDEYALVSIFSSFIVCHLHSNDDITVFTDNIKNITHIVLWGLHLYPYIEKPVTL